MSSKKNSGLLNVESRKIAVRCCCWRLLRTLRIERSACSIRMGLLKSQTRLFHKSKQ